jgi:hypothetical protein
MKRCAVSQPRSSGWAAALAATLSMLPAAARAQEAPAAPAAPATGPAEAAPAPAQPAPPARSYPPPPPRRPGAPPPGTGQPPGPSPWQQQGVQQGGQWGYQPVHRVSGVYRPFSFTVGVGPGALFGPGEDEIALSYNLFRLGFGVVPNLQAVLGFEGTGTNSTNPATGADSWLKQENWLLGIQYHVLSQFYVRGSMGAGHVSEHTSFASFSGGWGVAFAGAVGFEFVQTPHVALALDLNGSFTKYSGESWKTAGLNLALSFF